MFYGPLHGFGCVVLLGCVVLVFYPFPWSTSSSSGSRRSTSGRSSNSCASSGRGRERRRRADWAALPFAYFAPGFALRGSSAGLTYLNSTGPCP